MDNNQGTIMPNNPNNSPSPTTNVPDAPSQNSTQNVNTNVIPDSAPTPFSIQDQPSAGPVFTNKGHKKKKAIKTALAAIIAVLCMGAISFVIMFIVSSQPENMVASALNKLFTSKQVSVDGNINATLKNADVSLNVKFNTERSDSSNSATATAQINLPNFNQPIIISFNEIAIEYGTIYLKVGGISNAIDAYSEITNGPGVQENNPTIDMISGIVSSIEDRWIKISYEYLNNGLGQYVSDTYNCITDKLNNRINYTSELIILYKEHPFLNMEKEKDDFYNISLNTSHLTQYINSIPNTKLTKDINNCLGNNITSTNEISENDIENIYSYIPKISAKFDKDSLFSYELTKLKVTDDTDNYTIDSDLNFNYTDGSTISEPTNNIVSIKDLIEEVTIKYMQMQSYYTDYYNNSSN